MQTPQPLQQLLSTKYYNDNKYRYFLHWCSSRCPSINIALKTLVNSPPLYAWYCRQWLIYVENPMLEDYKYFYNDFVNNPELMLEAISSYTSQILPFYPKALLDLIIEYQKN